MRFPSVRMLPLLVVASVTASLGCAGRGAAPQPFPRPGAARLPGPVTASSPVLVTAMSLLGTPYRDGGGDPRGFDCSGFVQYVFAQHGIVLPRTVELLAGVGQEVGRPEPGDLVFFRTTGAGPTHVGIALGDDHFIHAPSSRGVVRIELLGSSYWARRYLLARRPADW